ncbi:uncharacterized protein A4U43_C08F16300 [Asparagus officinalis]|nr:uncharacterized protein A4U43_C08F16300 [Asparagus officinalis]
MRKDYYKSNAHRCRQRRGKDPASVDQEDLDDEERVGYEIDTYFFDPNDTSFEGDIGESSYIPYDEVQPEAGMEATLVTIPTEGEPELATGAIEILKPESEHEAAIVARIGVAVPPILEPHFEDELVEAGDKLIELEVAATSFANALVDVTTMSALVIRSSKSLVVTTPSSYAMMDISSVLASLVLFFLPEIDNVILEHEATINKTKANIAEAQVRMETAQEQMKELEIKSFELFTERALKASQLRAEEARLEVVKVQAIPTDLEVLKERALKGALDARDAELATHIEHIKSLSHQ